VDVIAHQAKQVQPHLELFDALTEPTKEVLPVGVVPEDRPPLITSGRYMVHGPFILDALRPRHVTKNTQIGRRRQVSSGP
jgi:hypothetical protein